jgi:hypothetical protein
MRRPILAGSLLLALGSVASSQSGTPPDEELSPMEIIAALAPASPASVKPDAKSDAAKKAKAGEAKVDPLAQCLRDWDAGTHMSRQDWARTCRRVVNNRAKLLRVQDND